MKLLAIVLVLLCALGAALVMGLGLPLDAGFKVGSVQLSPFDILIAIALFLLVMVITKRVQILLTQRWLPRSGIEPGLGQSIVAVTGYAGFALGFFVAISTAGINLSSFAVVAGALSVGIGFGLQNIVNNFVSGLILLFERPVKAGDWVVVGTNEGLIRHINVRSTEIETFNLASVIVPNADLIAHPVTNWTHKSRRGRVEVKVQVSSDSDPRRVQQILLGVARGHGHVVDDPAPSVIFSDILPVGFDFLLGCYTDDVLLRGQIASELRFQIVEVLRANGVLLTQALGGTPMGPTIPAAGTRVGEKQD